MSRATESARAAHWAGSVAGRVIRAWRALPPERRLAAATASGLFLTLFLPWYQVTVLENGAKKLQTTSATLTGWGSFSFVEAAVLLVAVGVLVLLIQRAEGRAFHLPGGDGGVILAAGIWTCGLIVWRIFDKQGTSDHGQVATTSGIEWGIFAALGVAAALAYAGSRIRAAHQPEPPLPGDDPLAGEPPPRGGGVSDDVVVRRPRSHDPGLRGPGQDDALLGEDGGDDATKRYEQRPRPATRRPADRGAPEEQLTIPLEREE